MGLKEQHRVFFATPFDVATLKMYEWVGGEVRRSLPALTTAIGTAEVGPSPGYDTIASFKSQNVELIDRIVGQIQRADVVVADLTNNNPNVHVELGVALTLNKNVLRVTGRSLTELGFDIRGLEVHQYRDREDLLRRVLDYMVTFKRIKDLPLDETAGALYRRDDTIRPFAVDGELGGWQYVCLNQVFRDGAMRVRFEFRGQRSDEDWFGVYLRTSRIHPWLDSCLVYVRRNGIVEVATYPGTIIRERAGLFASRIEGEVEVLIEIEGDSVKASVGDRSVRYDGLESQGPGLVCLGAWQSSVECRRVETTDRDTIEFV